MHLGKLYWYANQFLFPKLGIEDTISKTSAVCWLKRHGFKYRKEHTWMDTSGLMLLRLTKSSLIIWRLIFSHMYSVQSIFFLYLLAHIDVRFCYKYEGENMETVISPNPQPGKKIHYLIFYDKCCIHANDQCTCVWMQEGEQHHTLEPADEWVPPPPPVPFKSYCLPHFDIIYPNANHNPWSQSIAQVSNLLSNWEIFELTASWQTENAIRIFNCTYPEGIMVFIINCSLAHRLLPYHT